MPQKFLTIQQIIGAYWPVPVISFASSLILTPLCRWFARSRNIVDRPDDLLKPHKRPIPYLGGVAIFGGWAIGLVAAYLLIETTGRISAGAATEAGPHFQGRMLLGILLAGAGATWIGLLDDLRTMAPKVKLAGLTVVAGILIACGVGDDTFKAMFKATGIHAGFPNWMWVAYSAPITWFIVAGACNATNLIDGMDGLCSGVLGIMAAGFLVLAVHMHLWSDWDPLDAQRVVLSLAMLGAALGFLPYNRNPATIFMGDAGSMLLGLNAAILLLLFAKSGGLRWMLGSLMVFGLPLADMVLTLLRRWRNQRPLMQGDRSHFYDQLVDRGWPVRKTVRLSYAIAALFAVAGCSAVFLRMRYFIPLYAVLIAVIVWLVLHNNMLRVESKSRSQ